MLEPSLNVRPDDFSLKMLEAYLDKRDILNILSDNELDWLEHIIQDMHSPYIFKFSALVSIRRDREEHQNPCRQLDSMNSITGLFLTRHEHYYKRRREIQEIESKRQRSHAAQMNMQSQVQGMMSAAGCTSPYYKINDFNF